MLANIHRSICLYGFNYTAPSIILQLGYTTAIAQLLTVPLYMLGVVTTLIVSVWSDRVKSRWPFIVGPYCITMLAFIGKPREPHTLLHAKTDNPRPPLHPPPKTPRAHLRPSIRHTSRRPPTPPHMPSLGRQQPCAQLEALHRHGPIHLDRKHGRHRREQHLPRGSGAALLDRIRHLRLHHAVRHRRGTGSEVVVRAAEREEGPDVGGGGAGEV